MPRTFTRSGIWEPEKKTNMDNKYVTFHAKTCYNDLPLHGWNERPSNGLQTGHQAVLNGFQRVFERVIKYSERVA